MNNVVNLAPFRFWCHKVIPLVYDDSLSYYELLCKVVQYLNTTVENVNILNEGLKTAEYNFNLLKHYVDTYFENVDVQDEINNKLDEMAASGALSDIIRNYIGEEAEVIVWGYNENYAPTVYQAFNLIKLGNGKNLLMDCGRADETSTLSDFFEDHGVTKIDYFIISHYHGDHAGGFEDICALEGVDVEGATIFLPPAVDATKAADPYDTERDVIACAQTNNMTIVRPVPNHDYDLTGVVKARFYNTNHDYYYNMANGFDYNDCCLVTEIKNGNTNILYPADITITAQNQIKDDVPHADILYMAHHGTNNQVNREYIAHISPDVFIAINGTGSSGSNTDFLNKYSAENYVAQKKSKWVYATSEETANDYMIKYTFNSFAYQFYSRAIENRRTGEETYCLADFTELPRTQAENMSYTDMLAALKDNSQAVFAAQSDHYTRPYFKSANFIEKYVKSNSAGYMNTQARTYVDGEVYSLSTEQSTDLYHVFAEKDSNDDWVYHKEILTGLQYIEYQTYNETDMTSDLITESANPMEFNDMRWWNGDFLTYNNNGKFDVNEAGIYLVFVYVESNSEETLDDKTGSSGRIRLMREGVSTPLGGMRWTNVDNNRTYESAVFPVYLSRTYKPYFDIALTQGTAEGVGGYNVTVVFARLSVDPQVDNGSFFGLLG